MPRILAVAAAGVAAFAAITVVALEGRGVAVLATGGGAHRTRVWFARDGGSIWVEAATESRPFFQDLRADPDLDVELHEGPLDRPQRLHARAELVPEPGGHERIRAMLAERYGWADRWIAMLTDTSASRAVRITPLP